MTEPIHKGDEHEGRGETRVVSRDAWLDARKALLAREKAFTREGDAISAARRALPATKVEKRYVFDEAGGTRTLLDLFDNQKQLIVYHFMFGPNAEVGCKNCSFIADGFDAILPHLAARDTAFAVISRGPVAKLDAFKARMGWHFRWLSSGTSDFNYDFNVSFRSEDMEAKRTVYNYEARPFPQQEAPGLSTFLRRGNDVLHTYSTFGRGLDPLMATYKYLDLTPLGRHEEGLPYPSAWVRHHDRYGASE